MKLLIQERRKENGERTFIGMIQKVTSTNKNGTIIINETGIIQMVTKATLDLFGGFQAGELLHKVSHSKITIFDKFRM